MAFTFTAVYRKAAEGGHVGFVEELPGANTQGETMEEVRENLRGAVALVLEGNRLLAEEALSGQDVVREPLPLQAASSAETWCGIWRRTAASCFAKGAGTPST